MDPKVPIWIDDSSDEEQQPAKPSASASSHVPILETRMSSISVTRASAPASAPTIPPSAISHRKEPSTKLDRMMGDIHDGREARIAVGDEKHRVYNVPEPRGHLVRLRRSRAPPPPDLSQHLQVRPVQETVATGFNQQANTGNNNLADALPNSSSSKSANAPSGYSASTAINWPRSQQLAPHATPGTHLAIQSGGSVQDKPRGRSPPVSLFPPMLPSATQLTQSQANFLPPANSLPPTSHMPAIQVPAIHPPSQPSALRPQFNAAENMLFAAASRTQAMQGPTIPEINLPFAVEHSVLTTIQKLLEGALFDFAKKWAPKFLDEVVGWSAAEQGELSAWAPNLRKRPGEFMFAFKRFNNAKSPNGFLDILNRLTELRHVAVHRRAIGTYGLKRFLPDALEIASILHDVPRYLGLRAIEWAVWKPEAVGIPIQEVVAKPLEDLATMSLPPRDNYVRFVEISGLWLCPGTHKGAMPFGQPCALDYQGGPIPPPQPQLKRGRSPSPQHQPRPAARVKRVKRLKVPAQVVDLTSDDEEEKDNAPASAKTVIDLTEE